MWLVPRCIVEADQVTPEAEAASSAAPSPRRRLSAREVLGALHCERFVDKAPAQVWATLLDEGTYLCSIRTMYRILEEHGEVRERRNQRRHPNYHEAGARWPKRPTRFGRGILRSFVAPSSGPTTTSTSSSTSSPATWLAGCWLTEKVRRSRNASSAESCRKQDIEPDQLTLHADRGSSMRSKPVASAPG